MSIPHIINAGTTLDIPITLTAYPAPGWKATLYLRGAEAIDVTAVARGSQHLIHADAETTSGWPVGSYWYQLRVTDGSAVEVADEGEIQIKPDFAHVDAQYDGRDHVQRVLDAIEAVIEGRASKDQERYRIKDRELYRTPIGDLLKLRNVYRNELARAKAAKRGSELLGRRVLVRF